MEEQTTQPLRLAPLGRSRGPTRVLDLPRELAALRRGLRPGKQGHRQTTLFHRGPVAHVLFAFEAGGCLDRHAAAGLVTLHALEGRLIVSVEGRDHELRAGGVLVLNPGAAHAVHAVEPSALLLTVHMDDLPALSA